MRPRFLVPDLSGREVTLPPEEAHHLTRVLRLNVGDEIGVFDGRGTEFTARVATAGRGGVTVTLLERVETARPPAVAVTLVQAILKTDAMDDVVRDAAMVGVHTIRPVLSEHTTVKSAMVAKGVERWRRIALASAKQCGRATLPVIAGPVAFQQWIDTRQGEEAYLLVEPAAETAATVGPRDLLSRSVPPRASLVVGPEGGWSTSERDAAISAGCTALSLGRLTLRADRAALAAAAVVLALWDRREE